VAGNAPTPCDRVVGDLARTRLQLLFAPLRHTAGMPATTAHPRMHLSDLQPHCIDHGIGVRFTAILLLDDEPVAAVTGDGTASTTANRPTQPCMKPAPTRPAAATTAGPSPYRACARQALADDHFGAQTVALSEADRGHPAAPGRQHRPHQKVQPITPIARVAGSAVGDLDRCQMVRRAPHRPRPRRWSGAPVMPHEPAAASPPRRSRSRRTTPHPPTRSSWTRRGDPGGSAQRAGAAAVRVTPNLPAERDRRGAHHRDRPTGRT
jgi:hypothetical protein